MIDHDALFKALIGEFFLEFLELFLPELAQEIEPGSVTEKEQELVTDLVGGTTNRVDIIRQLTLKLKDEPQLVLILIEPQSYEQKEFGERLFRYFLRLYDKYRLPILPIAILSYDSPKQTAASSFTVRVGDFTTVSFNFVVIQLNQLNWRDFEDQANPVACALMAKMAVAKHERVDAKLAALSQLTELGLNPARLRLVSAFIDTYLSLNEVEQTTFEQKLAALGQNKKEEVMELTTSWKQEGIREGIKEGIREGERNVVLKLLTRRFGALSPFEENQINRLSVEELEQLAGDILEFKSREELTEWLARTLPGQDN